MTITQAITQADHSRHNIYTQEQKVQWLSELDWKVKVLILDTHEGDPAPFSGYDTNEMADAVLLVPSPFDEIYLYWLEAKICYADSEVDDYNMAIAQYNALWTAFANYYNRKHMPKQTSSAFLF